jgi:hypothetical protein
VAESLNGVDIRSWHDATKPDEKVFETVTKNGYRMLMTENQLVAYIDLGGFWYELSYDADGRTTIDYLQTFQMMINSLELIPAPTTP